MVIPRLKGKMRPQFVIIDAPSIVGLRPTGVEHLPEALRAAGLLTDLRAEYAGRISSLLIYLLIISRAPASL